MVRGATSGLSFYRDFIGILIKKKKKKDISQSCLPPLKLVTQIWARAEHLAGGKKKTKPNPKYSLNLATTENSNPLEEMVNKIHHMNAITPAQKNLK